MCKQDLALTYTGWYAIKPNQIIIKQINTSYFNVLRGNVLIKFTIILNR